MRHARPTLLLAPLVVGVLALTGCGSSDEPGVVDPVGAPVESTATADEPVSEPSAPPTDPDDEFPDVVAAPEQGSKYGVVVLGSRTDEAVATSLEEVATYGFTALTADPACLQVSGRPLRIRGDSLSYLVFADIDEAQDFYSLYTYLRPDAVVLGALQAVLTCES